VRSPHFALRFGYLLSVATVAGAVAVTAIRPTPLIVFNASASAPVGFYRVLPAMPVTLGDLVLVATPEPVRKLAAERQYIPETVPLVKRAVAISGALVCASGQAVTIDGRHVADRRLVDGAGRVLPAWTGCHRLGADEIFLLMADVPDSFDSRYFGPVRVRDVIGRLKPIWLR
jgi:conjugative transfer signal peptidase TraF